MPPERCPPSSRNPVRHAPERAGLGQSEVRTVTTTGAQLAYPFAVEEAVAAYREALEALSRERVPLQWAASLDNLGQALVALGMRQTGTEQLEDAVASFRAALSVFEQAGSTSRVSETKENLDRAQTLLAKRRGE